MLVYLRRMAEAAFVAFLGAASASLLSAPQIDRAALHGAIAAGVAALYGLVVKRVGDQERPTAL